MTAQRPRMVMRIWGRTPQGADRAEASGRQAAERHNWEIAHTDRTTGPTRRIPRKDPDALDQGEAWNRTWALYDEEGPASWIR
ncbi:MAG TPA: hypothetical protein VGS97_10615 [Actinocrinis sp.]|uniref:hypothetical protein n=1 Tax=Actinocrinis sp. TaxID=1920516 RepID=UPI002DDCD621|nr:hypothetical protein [Actinocrinis sp.]HEV2344534.1 hypothetical protein [Actinocrinis sp.]